VRSFYGRLVVSCLLGLMIATLWGANLTAAYPIVKLLMEHTSLHDYVNETIQKATDEESRLKESLQTHDDSIAVKIAQQSPQDDPDYVSLLKNRSRVQSKLAETQRTLFQYGWLQCYIMPIIPQNSFQTFSWLMVILIAATAVKGVLIFFQDMLVGFVSESVVMNIRKEMLQKVLKLDYQSLSIEGTSGLMSRFTYDAENLSASITMIGGRMIREPMKCIACMVMALMFNWRLTLLSLICIPLLGLFLQKFGKMLKRASRRMMESMSLIYKVLEETFDGLKVVIGYHNGDHHRRLFDDEYQSYFRKSMKLLKIDAAAKPLLELLGMSCMLMALVPGAYLVLRQKTEIWGIQLANKPMDGADLAIIYALLAGMLDPCRKLSAALPRLKRCTAAIDRIFQLMDQETLVADPAVAKPFERHRSEIDFRDVSFRYRSSDRQAQRGLALEHMNLNISFGEVVAIVGPNGCGKSTLVNLLPRFYDPDEGEILLDGRPLKEFALADLRRQIGIVTQETILFDGTLLDNIRYGTPDATFEQVEEAARRAHVLPILQSLPQGFHTPIGNKGKELSGGQRQRIALARVILRNPAILVLDEATSAIDAESEALIHETLKEFSKNRTTFLISHSISQSLLDFITKIVVMDRGQVIAIGTHQQLLESCPLYHRLVHAPSRKRAAAGAAPVTKAA
jgi:subfamily B ATP-binding cassette protein MsbA